jgi:hypothetical protein
MGTGAPERILDQAEAERKWRVRLVVAWVLIAVAMIWTAFVAYGANYDYGVAFNAGVSSAQCSGGKCLVDLGPYTQPNGEQVSGDDFDGVNASRIHVRPDGSRYMTLYWFSSDDTTDTSSPFWMDIWILIGSDLVLGLAVFAILFSGRHIRRQAKPAVSTQDAYNYQWPEDRPLGARPVAERAPEDNLS